MWVKKVKKQVADLNVFLICLRTEFKFCINETENSSWRLIQKQKRPLKRVTSILNKYDFALSDKNDFAIL